MQLRNRPLITRRRFRYTMEESAVLVKQEEGTFNSYGERTPGTITRTDIRCASEVIGANSRQMGEFLKIIPDGVQIKEARQFWVDDSWTVEVNEQGDWIEYEGKSWRVFSTGHDLDGVQSIYAATQQQRPDHTPS